METPLVDAALGLLGQVEPYQGDRLLHVEAVARAADEIGHVLDDAELRDGLVAAAWLHDIGYAPALRSTGHHALDDAEHLRRRGWPAFVTSLVAHHSGAAEEAERRGLRDRLALFPAPPQELADLLTLADMTSGPAGQRWTIDERLQDVFDRYPMDHPVHQAVTRSEPDLRAAVERAQQRLRHLSAQPM